MRRLGEKWSGARLAALVGLALALLAGCESRPAGFMVSVPPPAEWSRGMEARRAEKNQYFKTNAESPLPEAAKAEFRGLDYWAPDPDYYFLGQVNLHLQPETFEIATTSGKLRECARVGWIGFELDGQPYRLQVYKLLDQPPRDGGAGFFLPFMDGTTGSETYPAGRYIDLVGPEGGPFILDFNMAGNPWCAYGSPERYVCPVTPPENRLPVKINAGERGYRTERAVAADAGIE